MQNKIPNQVSKLPTSIKEVIIAISKSRMGATVVLDEAGAIIGMITDGDIRRMLEQHNSIQDLKAADIFHKKPITISSHTLAIEAFDLMKGARYKSIDCCRRRSI